MKNAVILEEINKAKLWFHARKTRPIWVRLLEQDETVKTREVTSKYLLAIISAAARLGTSGRRAPND